MIQKPKFNEEKALAAILYISKMIPNVRYHKLMKVLYFAELRHMAKYGRAIVGDRYIAMKDGPVPSDVYNALKNEGRFERKRWAGTYFSVSLSKHVKPISEADLDQFSDSDIECLDQSIKENAPLRWKIIKDKSHDSAYKSVSLNKEISTLELVKVSGANEGMIKFIEQRNQYHHYKPA
jgi:hypothetical protein